MDGAPGPDGAIPAVIRGPGGMTDAPLVSVLMPTYNAERYLGEAIDSILAQTLSAFECLVVDDGSTDGTLDLVRAYQRRDRRIRFLACPRAGIATALNAGLAATPYPFLARMDADDRTSPDRLAQQVAYLLSHPECVAVGGQAVLIDPEGLPICPFTVPLEHAEIDGAHLAGVGGRLLHGAATFRTEALRSVGGWRATYEPAEDFDLSLRLAEVGVLANLPAPTLEYRMHPRGAGYARAQQQTQCLLAAVEDARRRRRLPPEPPRLPALPPRRSAADFHREWAVNAARSGHAATAHKHARRALLLEPAAPQTWSVMARAFLPRAALAMIQRLRGAPRSPET